MNWLLGILHDTKEDDVVKFSSKIDDVLADLLPDEKKKVLEYIDQLTSDEWLSSGEKKKDQILRMEKMDIVPTWIRIFDKYDNCRRFKQNPAGKKKSDVDGYFAIAWCCYDKGIKKHPSIEENLDPNIRKFY